MKWNLKVLIGHCGKDGPKAGLPDGTWVPARPVSMFWNFRERVRAAWDVFTHKADAVYWEQDFVYRPTGKLGGKND